MTDRAGRAGFTLIEVLVALAILVVVAGAALALVAQSTRLVAQSERRLYASIVADNAMAEALAGGAAELGDKEGEVELAGGKWIFVRTVTKLDGVAASRIDVAVRRAGETQALARISTVIRAGGSKP